MVNKQPKIKIESTVADRFFELLIVFAAIAAMLYSIIVWNNLPNTVPTHFDLSGKVNGYGNKIGIISFIPLTVILYVMMTLLQRVPHIYNYTVKITEENAQRQYSIAVRLMRVIKLEIVAMFSMLLFITTLSAKEGKMVIGIWFVPVTVIVMFVSIGMFIAKSIKAK